MDKANQRIKMLERDLQKIQRRKLDSVGDDDSDDDDLDDTEAIKIEMEELKQQNAQRQATLDEYEKNKKWNVDNMFEVKEERTEVNKKAAETNYTKTGYAQSTIDGARAKQEFEKAAAKAKKKDDTKEKTGTSSSESKSTPEAPPAKLDAKSIAGPAKPASGPAKSGPAPTKAATATDPSEVDSDPNFVYTYHEFTEKYADLCEEFMALHGFDESEKFLLKHGDILLQEHAANYLLLATLEDEMNGLHKEAKQRAKQSQIVTNIAELAKSWNTHPGNVIKPFFQRLGQREFLEGFLAGVKTFEEKIKARAVVKRKEMDAQRSGQGQVQKEGVDLEDLPKEERLGPGGLDPLEVIESLPKVMQDAFESRDVDELRKALMSMTPEDAEYHMNRCIASGLWNANG